VIDTLALAERLEREYGDDPERARRHARILGDMAVSSDLATKQDIKELRAELQHEIGGLRAEVQHEISGLRAEVQHEIGDLRAEVQREIGGLRAEVQHEFAVIRTEVREVEQRLLAELYKEIGGVRGEMGALAWKMAGLLLAQAAAIVALIKLLP
jgi:vacuolar-type H+-ATPase subunit I/STV1